MPTIKANNINIEYDIHGSGEPLLLIAGLGYDRWMWHKMIPDLADHFQVIAFDNRGVGGTDKPKGPYTAQLLADDTAALLTALGVGQTAVLGHSMGGFVAQALALSYPHLISKLILSATNFGGPNHIRITQEALLVLMDSRGDPIERLRRGILVSTAPGFAETQPEFIEEWVAYRVAHPLDPAAYEAQLAIGLALMSDEASFEHKLAQVQAPTLILFGDGDKVAPPGNADLLAQRLPHGRVVLLPGVGHFYPFEAPELAVTAVTQFLGM
ncbi:MAG: alpha/beta hydrolase fold protein [Chloroflexota bacterium]|nr:alpha/beta fold hydrolase [Ardenticatenaceae bacterium]GIK57508.1 MAG: alpha/beta hydrolase fold protein [Chloroflexota bacterium]